MGDTSAIEWTDATWNPVTGCTKVSPGCDHCYAEGIANRFRGPAFPNGFEVTLRENRLREPLKWREPRRVFVNSMSDLFHDSIPDEYIARVFAVMAQTPQHTYQVLTKRHARMRSLLDVDGQRLLEATQDEATAQTLYDAPWPLPNVWLGVSVEDQKWADIRIPALLDTPATVRFLSCEPLLGPVTLERWTRRHSDACFGDLIPFCTCERGDWPWYGIDWVIVGGESGAGARPMHADWARTLRDECVEAGIPFFFKQWGTYDAAGHRAGKKAAGRILGGRTWDEYPVTGGSAVAHA